MFIPTLIVIYQPCKLFQHIMKFPFTSNQNYLALMQYELYPMAQNLHAKTINQIFPPYNL